MFQAWTVLCTLVYLVPGCLNTVLGRLCWLEILFGMSLPYWLLQKPLSLSWTKFRDYFSFQLLFIFKAIFLLSHEFSSNINILHPDMYYSQYICYSSFCVTCSSGKAESTYKLNITNLKTWNRKCPKSKTLWMPTWCHSGKFHSIKCLSWKKKGLHRVIFRVEGICETLMHFEFRIGFYPKASTCVHANIPKPKQIWNLKQSCPKLTCIICLSSLPLDLLPTMSSAYNIRAI